MSIIIQPMSSSATSANSSVDLFYVGECLLILKTLNDCKDDPTSSFEFAGAA